MQKQNTQPEDTTFASSRPIAGSVRYGVDNPPPSEEIALARIESSVSEIVTVETALEMTTPETYAGQGSYIDWHRRAVGACGHMRKEVKFLRRWVDQQRVARKEAKREAASQKTHRNYDELGTIAREIKAMAVRLAGEIGVDYTVRYGESSPPSDLPSATARRAELTRIKDRLGEAFQEVTIAWTSHPLRREEMGVAKAPLNKILKKVEAELRILKAYIASNSPQLPSPVPGWKSICIGFFDRMLENGADLTDDESDVLAWMKATKAPSS